MSDRERQNFWDQFEEKLRRKKQCQRETERDEKKVSTLNLNKGKEVEGNESYSFLNTENTFMFIIFYFFQ